MFVFLIKCSVAFVVLFEFVQFLNVIVIPTREMMRGRERGEEREGRGERRRGGEGERERGKRGEGRGERGRVKE